MEEFIFMAILERGQSYKLDLNGTLWCQFPENVDFLLPLETASISLVDAFGNKHKSPFKPPKIAYKSVQRRLIIDE